MKKQLLIAIAVISGHPVLGAVIVYVPPEPLLTLPDQSSDRRYDVNSDGIDDFFIGGVQAIGTSFGTIAHNRYLAIPAIPPNSGGQPEALGEESILGSTALPALSWLSTDSSDGFVSPDEIGSKFTVLTLCLDTGCTGTFYTDFINGELNAFLGFEFGAADGVHYGYFDLTFTPLSRGGVINGWAYESKPNTPITTVFIPEPSIGLLALVASLICITRRLRSDR